MNACDLFIYVGGESDEWVEDALPAGGKSDIRTLNLLGVLGDAVKTEEEIEGMEHEHEEHGEADEADEHVWLSLKNAVSICSAITQALSEINPEYKAAYTANCKAYTDKLKALDAEYQQTVDATVRKTVLFGDRFPFRYLADDYGLEYFAAFSGCSAESEASFETISFLAAKVDELSLPVVLTIEGGDNKIAQTIVQNTAAKNAKILSMNSLQSIKSDDISGGESYLEVMTENLAVLKQALL